MPKPLLVPTFGSTRHANRRLRLPVGGIVPSGGRALSQLPLGDTYRMEKLRDWFGTPVAAGKTLVWLCWVSLLIAIFSGLFYLLALGVLALFT